MTLLDAPIKATTATKFHGVLKGNTLVSCTNRITELLTDSDKTIKGKSIFDFSPKYQPDGEASTHALNLRIEAANNGLSQAFEWRFIGKNNHYINTIFYLQRQTNKIKTNHFVFQLKVLENRSSQREPIRESKLLLQQMLDNSTAIVYVKDYEGYFQFINQQFVKTFDCDEKEIIGKSVFEIFSKDVAQSFIEADKKVFQSKRPMEFEESAIVNGEPHTYLSIKFPLFNNINEVYAVCGISTDITERKKTEDAFRNVALGVSGASYDNVFEAIVWHLAETLDVDFCFIGRYCSNDTVTTLAAYNQNQIVPNITYDLADTPCEGVVGKDYLFIPKNIQQLFPGDGLLCDLQLEAYAGFPLYDSKENQQGLIAIGNRKPLAETNIIRSVMEIFSVRASAELERLEADEAKRISDESYRSIFDTTEDAIFIHDPSNGSIIDVNPKACESYGYTQQEFLNFNMSKPGKNTFPFDSNLVLQTITKANAGETQHVEWQRTNKDGTHSWDEVFVKHAIIAGDDRILIIARDITQKKIAEDQLKSKEEQYRVIFNTSVDGIILFDEKGNIIDVNPMFKTIHGYDENDDFSALKPSDIIPEDHLAMYQDYIQTVAMEGRAHISGEGIKKDGSRIILDIHGVRMTHLGSTQLLTITRDITEQTRAQIALRKSEDRLRATFDAALDAIISMDEKGNIVEFNPAACSCFGYTTDQVLSKPLVELIVPAQFRTAHNAGMKHYLNTGKGNNIGKRIEITAMRANGEEFPAELAIDVTQGSEGKLFIGYMRDITEHKRAEENRQKLEAQLRQAQKMEAIGHLSGGIAHDFNNILTSILGSVVLAEDKVQKYGDEKLIRYLSRASRSGQKAKNLIQQMLTFSRGQRGEPRAMALAPLVNESIKLLEASLPSSVEIELDLDDDCSNIMIDPVHLEQILMNLCINARDAVYNNGCIKIAVQQHQCPECTCDSCRQPFSGNHVMLTVSDNGSGIPTNVLERMFEPFYSTKEVGKGSGMGLSTVHGIVHDYGGHISVSSTPSQGTTIRILFQPLNAIDMSNRNLLDISNNSECSNHVLKGNVLVVDDEPDVAEFMQDMLEEWGLNVCVKIQSIDALNEFTENRNKFDLIITDHTMPKLTGINLAKKIRLLNKQIPIILYTGYNEGLENSDLKAAGINRFIIKPIDIEDTYTQIKELL